MTIAKNPELGECQIENFFYDWNDDAEKAEGAQEVYDHIQDVFAPLLGEQYKDLDTNMMSVVLIEMKRSFAAGYKKGEAARLDRKI